MNEFSVNETIARPLGRGAGVLIGHVAGRPRRTPNKLRGTGTNKIVMTAVRRVAFFTGVNLLLKPGINANIRYYLDFSEKVSDFPKTQHAAELISYHLKDLRVERIGVDGLPNKPKSI